jgi:hypothetical protein
LSSEKWHPFSHYVFNSDGTPIVDSFKSVSQAPLVPDVLCIDLPTGFDASKFSKSTTKHTILEPSHQKPTVVALPAKVQCNEPDR